MAWTGPAAQAGERPRAQQARVGWTAPRFPTRPRSVRAPWTIRQILGWMTDDLRERGFDSPRLDAELLVAHALGVARVGLYLDLDRPLTEDERAAIRALVVRRRAHEPVAYILGYREFYGRRFTVCPAVLVPRPDTETLVDRALALLDGASTARVLDLCTGSAAIAITVAAERPGAVVDATELSTEAAAIARRNAGSLGVDERVRVLDGDLFSPLDSGARYDLIVANPPYIRRDELAALPRDVRAYEPAMALDGGDDGLDLIRRIVAEAPRHLAPRGHLLIEIGHDQAAAAIALVEADRALTEPHTHADLGGHARVLEARLVE